MNLISKRGSKTWAIHRGSELHDLRRSQIETDHYELLALLERVTAQESLENLRHALTSRGWFKGFSALRYCKKAGGGENQILGTARRND